MAQKQVIEDDESLEIETDEDIDTGKQEETVKVNEPEPLTMPVSSTRRMTSRQRALYSGQTEVAVETPPPEPSQAEPEQPLAETSERKLKRKIMRQEKLESDKQATIDKLLKKQVKSTSKRQTLDQAEEKAEQQSCLPPNIVRTVQGKESSLLYCNDLAAFQQFQTNPSKLEGKTCKFCGNERAFVTCTKVPVCSSRGCYDEALTK